MRSPTLLPGLPFLTRPDTLQHVLDLYENPAYLEIGLDEGNTFRPLRAARKVGVDPALRLDPADADFAGAEFHAVSSDEYFGEIALETDRFDVIYLDGLHTAEQTLRDLLNAIAHLAPRGAIIIDDIVPSSYPASLPDRAACDAVRATEPASNLDWMGDVYKLVFFVESFLPRFSYATVANNHGMLVLWRERRAAVPARTLADIAAAQFAEVVVHQASLHLADIDTIGRKLLKSFDRGTNEGLKK